MAKTTWQLVERAAQSKRERYARLKRARTCPKDGAWMEREGEYHYRCPRCGDRKLRK